MALAGIAAPCELFCWSLVCRRFVLFVNGALYFFETIDAQGISENRLRQTKHRSKIFSPKAPVQIDLRVAKYEKNDLRNYKTLYK
jgi:hypothetical protein